MHKLIARRLGTSVVAVFGVVLLVFILARLTGKPGVLFLSSGASPEAIEEFNRSQGFNDPVLVQLGHYLISATHLDFGQSLLFSQPALRVALEHFPYTLLLAGLAMLVSLLIAVPLGCLSAYYKGGRLDRAVSTFSSLAVSVPNFWLALLLILFLSVRLHVLPPSGSGSWQSIVLPIITLVVAPAGLLSQVSRNSMIEVLKSEYITAARAKGLSRIMIVVKHALRNAAIPIITIAGATAASMVNGVLIVETVFAWPGIGFITLQAVNTRDFALLQACIIVTATAVVIVNMVVDILYGVFDPRISQGSRR